MADRLENPQPHFTTRRGFILAAGFGVVTLYGLWAAQGAAPLNPFAFDTGGAPPEGAGGDEGHGEAAGMSPEEFRRLTDEFVAGNRLADGSVRVGRASAGLAASENSNLGAEHGDMHGAGHGQGFGGEGGQAATTRADLHSGGGHAMNDPAMRESREEAGHTNGKPAHVVYLLAHQWGYTPSVLRLDANVRYRFRMMAVDVTHGASIQLGRASRIIRLRAKTLVEQELQFTGPGEYLVYCTVYCGMPHDRMQGKIIVT